MRFAFVVIIATFLNSWAQLTVKNTANDVLMLVEESGKIGMGTQTLIRDFNTEGTIRFSGTLGNGASGDNSVLVRQTDGDVVIRSLSNDIWDGDSDNQTLGLQGRTLSISNGNSVTLPADNDNQTLSISGDQLSISGGNTVTLPSTNVTTDNSIAGNGSTSSPLSLGWTDESGGSASIAVKSAGQGQTKVGYLSNFTYDRLFADDGLTFRNDYGNTWFGLFASGESTLELKGNNGARIALTNDVNYIALSATPSYPTGYEASDSRLYTNGGIVAQGTASRFVNNLIVGMDGSGGATNAYLAINTAGSTFGEAFHCVGNAYIENGGMLVGNASGGLKGSGTLNAQAVYDDNVQITDYVFDKYFDGRVRPEDQYRHGDYAMLSLEEMAEFVENERHLPTIIGREEWNREGKSSVGSLINQIWETVETQSLYIIELKTEIDQLREELSLLRMSDE
ncbi:hypothetical protein GF406_00140 [candidate division KSB1 bacterium]|nr:hypothetical protein [candidate division KSB1 bacterium]